MGSKDVGLDCGMKRGKVVRDLEHYLLHIHSLHSQAVLYQRVLKDHRARFTVRTSDANM